MKRFAKAAVLFVLLAVGLSSCIVAGPGYHRHGYGGHHHHGYYRR